MGALSTTAQPSPSPTPLPSAAPFFPLSQNLTFPSCLSNASAAVVNGQISFSATLQTCLANIPDPLTLPTLYNGTQIGTMVVLTNVQLNNLHVVGINN